jgi:diadenosine tetraphosphate (Ap4A) HIT family hydrolase
MNDWQKVVMAQPAFIEDASVPWTELVEEDFHVMVFRDAYPVTEGHLLYVPKYNTFAILQDAFRDATIFGARMVQNGSWDGYNIGINIGEAAGQTVEWPHIHLIPRRKGDMEDPRGGVRHVIPEKGNYKKGKL